MPAPPPLPAEPERPRSSGLPYLAGGCLFIVALVVASIASMALFFSKATPKAAAPSAAKEAETRQSNMRRVFRENHRWDDNAREFIFRGSLKKAGERCDDVEKMIMGSPGSWTVTCSPGYRYLFMFDEKGELISASRLP